MSHVQTALFMRASLYSQLCMHHLSWWKSFKPTEMCYTADGCVIIRGIRLPSFAAATLPSGEGGISAGFHPLTAALVQVLFPEYIGRNWDLRPFFFDKIKAKSASYVNILFFLQFAAAAVVVWKSKPGVQITTMPSFFLPISLFSTLTSCWNLFLSFQSLVTYKVIREVFF